MAFDIITYALLKGKTGQIQSEIDTLNGDATVEGSVEQKIADAISTSPEDYARLQEIIAWLDEHSDDQATILDELARLETDKQDKLTAGDCIDISQSGQDLVISLIMDAALADDSDKPVSGATIKAAIDSVIADLAIVQGNIDALDAKVDDKTKAIDGKQDLLTAGDNVSIVKSGSDTIISATDTKYTAGTGIDIAGGVISEKRQEMTKEQYNALTPAQKKDGTVRYITNEDEEEYTAGEGIAINNNKVISVTAEDTLVSSENPIKSKVVYSELQNKQNTLTPGKNIFIENDTIIGFDKVYEAGDNITITKLQDYDAHSDTYIINADVTHYKAGNNVDIGPDGTINAIDTVYNDYEIRQEINAAQGSISLMHSTEIVPLQSTATNHEDRIAALEQHDVNNCTKAYNMEYEDYDYILELTVAEKFSDSSNYFRVSKIILDGVEQTSIPDFYHEKVACTIDNQSGAELGHSARFYWGYSANYSNIQGYDTEDIPTFGVFQGQYPGIGEPVLAYEPSINNGVATELYPGANVEIKDNVISAKDTKYTAGTGIVINNSNEIQSQLSYDFSNDELKYFNNKVNPKTNASNVAYGNSNVNSTLNSLTNTLSAQGEEIGALDDRCDTLEGQVTNIVRDLSSLEATVNEIDGNYLEKLNPVYTDSIRSNTCTVPEGYKGAAFGENNKVLNNNGLAFGNSSTVNGNCALAGGYNNVAQGQYSVALGLECNAVKQSSFAMGSGCKANELYSVALGYHTTANTAGFADGYHVQADDNSFVFGSYSTASKHSFVAGTNLVTDEDNQNIFGTFNAPTTNGLFIIGNGENNQNLSNAFVVYRDGKVEAANGYYVNGKLVSLPTFDSVEDEGKVLKIVNGVPTWVNVPSWVVE